MAKRVSRKPIIVAVLCASVIAGGIFVWSLYQAPADGDGVLFTIRGELSELWTLIKGPTLPEGFASGNGRIEAEEIDIATKFHGRVAEVLVDEGYTAEAGQVVARMDSESFQAEIREAKARVVQAEKQRNSTAALVRQRESECALAEKDLRRSRAIYGDDPGAIAIEQLDRDLAASLTTQAACVAAEAQVAEAEAAIGAAVAETERLQADLKDYVLKAPRHGRVLYRAAEPGEVLAPGGKVLTIIDLTDVYMTFFLPEKKAGKVAMGADARILLDAVPDLVIPAKVSFVAAKAQFTPKYVETRSEREKLMFRVKAQIDPALLKQHEPQVKTGVPGVAYVRLDPNVEWPEYLKVRVPE